MSSKDIKKTIVERFKNTDLDKYYDNEISDRLDNPDLNLNTFKQDVLNEKKWSRIHKFKDSKKQEIRTFHLKDYPLLVVAVGDNLLNDLNLTDEENFEDKIVAKLRTKINSTMTEKQIIKKFSEVIEEFIPYLINESMDLYASRYPDLMVDPTELKSLCSDFAELSNSNSSTVSSYQKGHYLSMTIEFDLNSEVLADVSFRMDLELNEDGLQDLNLNDD